MESAENTAANVKNGTNAANTQKLNSKVSEITSLLDNIEEMMGSYVQASNAEKKNIEKRFNETKEKAVSLQTEINGILSEMPLDKPVLKVLEEKYPKYVDSLEEIDVLNGKNSNVSKANTGPKNNAPKNNSANNAPKNNSANNAPKNNAPNNAPKNNSANNAPKNNSANNAPKNNAPNNAPKNNNNTNATVGGRRKSHRKSKKQSKRTRRGVRR